MADVVVLRTGYAIAGADGRVRASGTVTLVRSQLRILVDTGGPAERGALLAALAEHGLSPEAIDLVVCTHGHLDHVGNLNLFSHAAFVLGRDRCVGDTFTTLDLAPGALDLAPGPLALTADVRLLATPGHTAEDLSLLVDTPGGLVAIAGDTFEHADDEQDWPALSQDPATQRHSRGHLLALTPLLIPGHGPPFHPPR